ncbi:hypothetical protein ACIPWE_24905 [Streptomyces sp. NPDC090073]|uniref:hypothetical protein n=1 Tax=Streptomyces sp. NPDC090073 TaxID=3365936 RepID=UPI0037F78CB7
MQEEDGEREQSLKEMIRGDLIDLWRINHPDSPPPETVRELLSFWFHEKKEAVRGLPKARAERLQQGANLHAQRICELRSLEPEDAKTTVEAIRAAHWTENARASWSLVLTDLIGDHPSLVLPVGFVCMLASVIFTAPYMFRQADLDIIGGDGVLAIFAVLILLLLVNGVILSILRRVSPKIPQFWRLTVVTVGVLFLVDQRWRAGLREQVLRQAQHPSQKVHKVLMHADLIATYALRWFLICLVIVLIFSAVGSVLNRIGPKQPARAVITSRMMLELSNLALWSQAALDSASAAPSSDGLRPYVASAERIDMIRSLDRIARMAEGRWKRSLRVGDPSADSAVAALGEGIAASARKWKAVAAKGGSQLVEMNESFTQALVDAAKGDWELLASTVSGRELLRRRMLRALRRLLALMVMLSSALVVLIDPFGLMGKGSNPALDSLLLTFGAILTISIDPTVVERLGNASKIASTFSAKK